MISPLAILVAAAAQPARALVNVDEANFAKLCEHPNAQRLILNGVLCVDLDGVTYRHVDALYNEAPGANLDDTDTDTGAAFARSPLAILADAQRTPRADAARVDADTFAKLCARPGAQRFIVDGSILGVNVDGADHTVN